MTHRLVAIAALLLFTVACPSSEPLERGSDVASDMSDMSVDVSGGELGTPDVCVPDCMQKQCGDDGCGGSCGQCPGCPGGEAAECQADGTCPTLCCPDCNGKTCGDDGCGGSCGTCDATATCQGGSCISCSPTCDGKDCGDDGCGGVCGMCPDGQVCAEGLCAGSCEPSCAGKQCGDDGCGGSCGTCDGVQEACQQGACACIPACAGLACGDDGCGGACGTCTEGEICAGNECIPAPTEDVYTTFIGDWDMAPGQETTKCVVKRLSNVTPIIINKIRTTLAPGSHHMIVYKSNDTDEKPTPFNCTPFAESIFGGGAPLMITEISEETLEFPPGVGIQLEANQMIRLEAHYLNYYPDTITAHGDVEFFTADSGEISDLADFMFYGTVDINIPGDGVPYDSGWSWLPVHDDVNVFAITGHTHQWGTNVEITKSTSAGDEGTWLYPGEKPFVWSEAPVVNFDPPVTFGANDGFRFRCTWENNSGSSVGFGESANQEMCFLWAYYYPSKGYTICADGFLSWLCPN